MRANEIAAQIMEHFVTCPLHGYSQPGRQGTGGTCAVDTDGGTAYVAQGDRDCSSAVIDAWSRALSMTGTGSIYGASYTGNMRRAFVASGLFEWHPMGDGFVAQRGDVYLNEQRHTAMCVDDGSGKYGYDAMAEFSISETGGIDGKPGDQTGRESLVRPYSNFPWDGILHYVGGGEEPTYTGVTQVEPNLTDSQLVRIEEQGEWSIVRFANGQVLDVKGGTDAGEVMDGREVQCHAENGTDAQLWRLEPCGIEGAYWVVPKLATSKALDVCHGVTGERGNTQLHGKQGAMDDRWAQAWRIVPTIRGDWSMLVNAKSGYALDANPNARDYS